MLYPPLLDQQDLVFRVAHQWQKLVRYPVSAFPLQSYCFFVFIQQLHFTSMVFRASSRNISNCGVPHPIPSGCLYTASNSPLPGSALQTPPSSTQPLSTPAATCLRLGYTGLWHEPSVQVSLCPTCHRLVMGFSSEILKLPAGHLISLLVRELPHM